MNQANRVIKTGKTTYPSDIQKFMLDETVSSETLQNLPSYFWNMKPQKSSCNFKFVTKYALVYAPTETRDSVIKKPTLNVQK